MTSITKNDSLGSSSDVRGTQSQCDVFGRVRHWWEVTCYLLSFTGKGYDCQGHSHTSTTSPTVCAEAVYCCCVGGGGGILPVIGRWPVGKMSSSFLTRLSVAVCAWLTKATCLQSELFLDRLQRSPKFLARHSSSRSCTDIASLVTKG